MKSVTEITFSPAFLEITGVSEDQVRALLLQAVELHLGGLHEGKGIILKNAPESAVTIVELPGEIRVCVKEFRSRGYLYSLKSLFRPSQGIRALRNGMLLEKAGVGVARPLALICRKRFGLVTREWVIMEVLPDGLELDRYVLKRSETAWPADERRGLARLLGRFIGSMHAVGIFHADMKTCNIVVTEEPPLSDRSSPEDGARTGNPKFFLLDYDDVRSIPQVGRRLRCKTLLQLFLSTPLALGRSDRLRFLSEYALHVGMNRRDRRETALAVLAEAAGRRILYVGWDGDVTENWD
ncbi:MAG: lipopolysaccharide kinase InaA family protein [Pseudomonadota bacterium]